MLYNNYTLKVNNSRIFPESWNEPWRNTTIVILGSICNLALIPVFIIHLSPQLFGIWLFFSNLTTLMLLLLIGLDNTLPRLLSYILAGASKLQVEKISTKDLFGKGANLNLLSDFMKKSKELISKLTGIQVVIALLFWPYVFAASEKYNQVKVVEIFGIWLIYGIGVVLLFSFHLYNSLVRGVGEIWLANLLVASQRLMFLTLSTLMLLERPSLYSIAVAFLISNSTVFYFSKTIIDSKLRLLNVANQIPSGINQVSISEILRNTRLLAINSISGFLILRFSMLASVLVLDVNTSTQYNLTITLYLSLYGICLEITRNYTTRLNIHQAKKNLIQLRAIYRHMRFLTLSIFAAGASILIFFGNSLLQRMSPGFNLLPLAPLIVIFLIYMLELNHTISAIYLSSHNYFPMTGYVILAGTFIAFVGAAASTLFSFWGFILAHGLIQLLYNNWKWPYMVRKELRKDN